MSGRPSFIKCPENIFFSSTGFGRLLLLFWTELVDGPQPKRQCVGYPSLSLLCRLLVFLFFFVYSFFFFVLNIFFKCDLFTEIVSATLLRLRAQHTTTNHGEVVRLFQQTLFFRSIFIYRYDSVCP